jgi:hypothetical protein
VSSPLSDRTLHYQPTETSFLQIEPQLTDDFPIGTVGEFDQMALELYCNESLVDKIAKIEVLANTYCIASADRNDPGEIFGGGPNHWPIPLTETEVTSRWVALNIKPDQETSMYRKWLIDFHLQTPARIL